MLRLRHVSNRGVYIFLILCDGFPPLTGDVRRLPGVLRCIYFFLSKLLENLDLLPWVLLLIISLHDQVQAEFMNSLLVVAQVHIFGLCCISRIDA